MTRERLLDVAERHFAEHGYLGASQRAIQRDAKVNAASANYYFGSKEALFNAVVERHIPAITERRSAAWDAIPADLKGRARLEAILRAYMGPHLEVSTTPSGRSYGRIIAHMATVPGGLPGVLAPHIGPIRVKFLEQLVQMFPGASQTAIAQAWSFTLTLMLTAPFDYNYQNLVGRAAGKAGPAEWTDALTRFAMGGFESLCGPLAG